jgi:hypothetical protein
MARRPNEPIMRTRTIAAATAIRPFTIAVALLAGCNGPSSATSTGTPGSGGAGAPAGAAGSFGSAGAAGPGGTTGAGVGGANSGGANSGGAGTVGSAGGMGGAGGTIPIGGSGGGVHSCTPGVEELVITDCGYPYASSNPLTSTVFNENEVFRAIRPSGSWPNGVVQMFYDDEHAMTLGVRQVAVKTASGTTTTDYPVTALATDPGSAVDPQIGTTMLAGDQAGLDPSLRPMWPSLFVTDISTNPSDTSGDWQQGGRPIAPNAIFGSWKSALRNVDNTKTPAVTSITPDVDPAKNNWNLSGGDPVPAGLMNEGYGAEARWNVTLTPGHSYRLQVLVHDGDQNKGGGDSGEACVLFCAATDCNATESCGGDTGTGGSGGGGEPQCPQGVTACGPGGVAPSACPSGTVCANGCCLIYVN